MAETSVSGPTSNAQKQDAQHNQRTFPYGNHGPHASYNQYSSHSTNSSASLGLLAHSMQSMGLQDSPYSHSGRDARVGPPGSGWSSYNGIPTQYWAANNAMMMPAPHIYNANGTPVSTAVFTPAAAQYVTHAYGTGHETSPPMSIGWTPTHVNGELPSLVTPRRESISSADNDTPGTPSYGAYHTMGHNGPVTILNRSPPGPFNNSTPSPLQVLTHYGLPIGKVQDADAISPRLKMLVSKEPPIPPAIPAPSSPLKPLDRALENTRGETNVYIRGLMPETSDDMLETWGRRFGDIKSSKSIIDHNTGLCKGFGFVRYHNYKDAEDCIRGFHHLGYEVSFARESFYSKLKAIADDHNTNLYVSNLPKTMNEHELASIFSPHKVCSARILRNSNGTGRGVGFARFEGRTDCEEIIKAFNNKTINHAGEDHTIQIRYADTQEQKHLKQTTAAARQFRSAEYEFATQAHRHWLNNGRPSSSSSPNSKQTGNDFETYLGHSSASSYVPRSQTYAESGWRSTINSHRTPLSAVSANSTNINRGVMSIASTPLAKGASADATDGGVKLGIENRLPRGDGSPTRIRAGQEN